MWKTTRNLKIHRRTAFLGIALALVGSGCAGYKLGSTLPPDIKTVYVPVVKNETSEPLIENDTTRDIITAIQRDGALKVVPADQADAVLNVSLKRFLLTPIAYDVRNTDTPDEYRLVIAASFVMYRRATGQVIVEHPSVQGETTVRVFGDISTSKRSGLRNATQDLAREISDKMLEAWQ